MNSADLILIIEPNRSKNLNAVLGRAGYSVLSVKSFEAVLKKLLAVNPVLILCNATVDESHSIEICRRLRSKSELKIPPICFIGEDTSHSNQVHLLLETGAVEYIETSFEPLQLIRTVTKIIEGGRTKQSLEQKDVIFRSLIENVTDIITVISPDGFILYESPSVERILGRKPVDSLGTNVFKFIHPEDYSRVVGFVKNATREEAAKGVEYRIKHADGSWRIFHSVGRFNRSIFKTKTVLITSRDITLRNLLAERHQLALERARMVWWEWNPTTDNITLSDNFGEVYGIPDIKNAAQGFNLVHPEDIAQHRNLVEEISKSGGSYNSEFRITRADNGQTIWLEETATAVLDENNQVERLVGISVDISERKKAEDDIREREEKFRALFKGIPIPVYIWERIEGEDDFILVDSNDAGDKQTTSFSSSHFGMRASQLLDDNYIMINGLRDCIKSSKTINFTTEHINQTSKDLKVLDLHFTCVSPTLVMVVSRDITETKLAEEERAKLLGHIEVQNQRLNDIIASIPGVVWETHSVESITDQSINYVSEYIEKLTGYTTDEWLAESNFWIEIMHPEDKQQAIEKSSYFLKNTGEGFLEYRFIKKNGEIIWVETQIRAVKNDLGEITKLTGITLDVTERKKAESALLKSEEQLRQSQRLESVGRLAGGIAHDFNNMLTAINGYSELILRELKEESSIRQKVSEIKKAGERSALLTQQLLAFSRRQILKPQLLDLNHAVLDISVLLRHLIGEHIELTIDLCETECRIEADPGQLSQVIMNLAVNARDAMPNGGSLKITTANVYLDEKFTAKHVPAVPGDFVLLSVSDTGMGVDDETRKYIFEPFYTTKAKGTGTGLGLATVYGIVKQSGGYIWVDSEPGEGTIFEVYLPQIKNALKISNNNLNIETELPGKETILLVEDEAAVRELTVKILDMFGYHVIQASNGAEAFEIFKKSKEKISLLITDVVMPRMSGSELAGKIGEINPRIPVLFSSGYADDKNIMVGREEKDFDFINKPFTSGELGRKIRQLLDKKSNQQ